MTWRIEKNSAHSGGDECAMSQERSLGLSCHGNFSEVEKLKENIPMKQNLLTA